MSLNLAPKARYRKDYKAPSFDIKTVDLEFYLNDTRTRVISTMQVERQEEGADLILDGEKLELVSVLLNGKPLIAGHDYEMSPSTLTIFNPPEQFSLQIENLINPSANTALEGLYKSDGVYCSQCEAEGFRSITYFLDRPDVLAVYTTTIYTPDNGKYPYVLSNGNKISEGQTENGCNWVKWHDPFPKPAYLFALVAGDFDCLEDSFTTAEGRKVLLQLFVDKGNLNKAGFAMESLKNSMAWDEQRFGLSYDLDIYMVVAVDFFNMGAMENKGLNVFNAKYVLAEPASATDQDFINVEAVIGHEYFHNWTGNRVTCRDWFQLSLKEGLTVFREQEFSADRGMRPVNRIQDVRIMRTHQFEEDAGPTAHAIRPDKVVEMNNFYTVTIYNKGAEVVRMLHTLLGEQGFQAGMREYIAQQDGKAATCEDFVRAMEVANDKDLNQFRRWYSQAGTPELRMTTNYKRRGGKFTVTIEQLSDRPSNAPFHIPLKVEFVTASAEAFHPPELPENSLLELVDAVQSFEFTGFTEKPVFAPLADFSAPVKLIDCRDTADLITIASYAEDPFLRWDAVQQLYIQALKEAIEHESKVVLPEALIVTLKVALSDDNIDPAITALLLQTPSEEGLATEFDTIPVEAIDRVVTELHGYLSEHLSDELLLAWQRSWQQGGGSDFSHSSMAIAARMLSNACLNFMAVNHSSIEIKAAISKQFDAKQSMTLVFGALQAAVHNEHPLAKGLLSRFESDWLETPLVMDKWLAVQATIRSNAVVDSVQKLIEHGAFNWGNPNRIYALLASFSHNFCQLHQANGSGYRLLISAIKRLNTANPQVASRLLSPLLKWRRLDPERQELLRELLSELRKLPNLAPDLFEKIEQSFLD